MEELGRFARRRPATSLACAAGLFAASAVPPTDTEGRAVRAHVLRVGQPGAGKKEILARPDENRH